MYYIQTQCEGIDIAHGSLVRRLRASNEEYIKHSILAYRYDVLPHTYDDAGPLAQAVAFGQLLRDTLISEGYEGVTLASELLPYKGRGDGGYTPSLLIPLDGIDMKVEYCGIDAISYNLHAYHWDIGKGWRRLARDTADLIHQLPLMIDMVHAGIQCGHCHYGAETRYCGIGLVGTGECSHYMGHAPH